MRGRVYELLALTAVILSLAACGGSGKSTSTHSTSTSTFKHTTQGPAQVPKIAAAATACHGLVGLGSGTSSAATMKSHLDATARALGPLAITHAKIGPAFARSLRIKSVLAAMSALSQAAARYEASPSATTRQALIAAKTSEENTAIADVLSVCAVPAG